MNSMSYPKYMISRHFAVLFLTLSFLACSDKCQDCRTGECHKEDNYVCQCDNLYYGPNCDIYIGEKLNGRVYSGTLQLFEYGSNKETSYENVLAEVLDENLTIKLNGFYTILQPDPFLASGLFHDTERARRHNNESAPGFWGGGEISAAELHLKGQYILNFHSSDSNINYTAHYNGHLLQ